MINIIVLLSTTSNNIFALTNADNENKVILGGTPFGIKIFADGVMVVDTTDILSSNGILNPAREAGIRVGDSIKKVNGNSIHSSEQLIDLLNKKSNEPIEILVERDGTEFLTKITPVLSLDDKNYRIGVWVRDSCAGIGTLTFYDANKKVFAGLGHGVCDADTGRIIPLENGNIVSASISSVVKGEKGIPGELKGYFTQKTSVGEIKLNNTNGVYGIVDGLEIENSNLMDVEIPENITVGEAEVFTTIEGTNPQLYKIYIESINSNTKNPDKDLTVRIVDERLLELTGGIVQGMSGSPIIQNGKLIAALTHVFVNEPECGYAVFAYDMLNLSKNIK